MSETVLSDIVVAGGGVAGVCAALAAAREGAAVSLITNRPVLGGNSSSEIRVWTRGATGGGSLF
ncbi:MAG: FAD-dependent oxidoreductase, partial [Treponema sp.]|nr:FAD-dependent oxidoreductase [Treponema sp.]